MRRGTAQCGGVMTWAEIGAAMGITGSRAQQIYARAICKLNKRFGRDAAELLQWMEESRKVHVSRGAVR
jgi:DNA-directed RNA polymerase sigma subunit (sigma70/sigma32)